VVSLGRPFAVKVQRDDQQRLDKYGRIIGLNDDDSALADGDKIRMADGDPAAIGEADVEWLERLSMQSFTNTF
jgi:hypothetical protein